MRRASVAAILVLVALQLPLFFAGSASAAPVWGTPELLERSSYNAYYPSVAGDPSGNATAVWYQFNGTRYNIWANRLTPGQGWGTATLIERNDGNATHPIVSMDQRGNAFVVWEQSTGTGTASRHVWANRYIVGVGWGNATAVESNVQGNATDPKVSAFPAGGAIAVWTQYDGTRWNIWKSLIGSTTSSVWASRALVETNNSGSAYQPVVATAQSSKALVAWYQYDGKYYHVWAAKYNGTLVYPCFPGPLCFAEQWNGPVMVDTLVSASADDPAVAMDPTGAGAIAYRQYENPVYNIWAGRYVNATGTWTTPVRIESLDTGSGYSPQVTYNNLEIAVTWQHFDGTRYNIYANRYAGIAFRTWGGATLLDSSDESAYSPQIASDDDGNLTVAWHQKDGTTSKIWSSRYLRADGWKAAALIETDNSGNGYSAAVASNGIGAAVVAWYKHDGSYYNIWAARVREPTVPFAPQALNATAGNREVALRWQPVLDDGGRPVYAYFVYRGTSAGSMSYIASVPGQLGYNDTNRTNGVTYYYKVAAVNSVGTGAYSNVVNATPVAVPTFPLNLTLTPQVGAIDLSWSPPADPGGSNVTEYLVERAVQGDPYAPLGSAGLALGMSDTAVSAGTVYCYEVSARNGAGQGPLSPQVCVAPLGPPSAPQSLVVVGSSQTAQLDWEAPADDGGSAIINYEIYRSDAGTPAVWVMSANGTSRTQTGLQNGVNYCYSVTARNSVGESAPSPEACTTPVGLPSAPLAFSAQAGNREVQLTWSPPADTGGLEISGYRIYRRTPLVAETVVAELGDVNAWRDTDVVNGETYHYQATALALAGEGPRGQNGSATPWGLPSPPLSFGVSASLAGAAMLAWSLPFDDGGFAITTYRLHRGPDPGNLTLYRDAGSVFVFDDTGLPVAAQRCYTVSAVTSRGEGQASPTECVIIRGLPTAPVNFTVQGNGSTILVRWGPPLSTGGDPSVTFLLYRGTVAGTLTLLASPAANATEYNDSGVVPGIYYYYQIAAENTIGEGPRAAEKSAPAGTRADAPAGLAVSSVAATAVLTWSAPASTGGWAVTGYNVYRSTGTGAPQLIAQIGPSTSYTDTNVTAGTEYHYSVAARNEIGEGAPADGTVLVVDRAAAGGELMWLLIAAAVIGVVGAVAARQYSRGRVGRGAGQAAALGAPAAAAIRSAVPVMGAAKTGERTHLVENVFLLYQDGRAIFTRGGLGADAVDDPEIVGAMLVAVQDFVQDSFKKGASINRMSYGDDSILLEKGPHVILAVTVFGEPDEEFGEAMREAVEKVETTYAGVIDKWDGMHATFADVDQILEPLWAATADLTRGDVILATTVREVQMLSATEFYQGFVRLKVSVVNSTGSVITGVTVDVDFNADVLRLHKIEPATYKAIEAKVNLGVVNTAEKVTLAYYFDPQICTSSALEGTCRYKDAAGEFHTIKMKSRTAEVVCPLFFTQEHANPAMLKRLIEGGLNQFDIKAYAFKEGASDEEMRSLFELTKSAVGAHEIQQVRSFERHRPYVGEAWYYGKTQKKGYDVIVRCLVDAAQHRCEFYAASSSMQAITGLLAELSRTLSTSLKDAKKVANLDVRPLFDDAIREKYADRRELSKSLDGSLPAGDIAPDG